MKTRTKTQFLAKQEALMVAPFAFAIGMRMLGLFLLLPVLSPYVISLPDGNIKLAGIALGVYGLTQAMMLVPLGWLSDKVGRKPVLVVGLVIFALGGLLAASVAHPAVVILGRALQGLGAISAVAIAAIGDVTTDKTRPQAMAIVGISIAASFAISVVIATPLALAIGVRAIFIMTAIFGIIAALLVAFVPFKPLATKLHDSDANFVDVKIIPYCLGAFVIHFAMAAMFLLVPLMLPKLAPMAPVWLVFLSAFLLSLLIAAPFIIKGSPTTNSFIAAAASIVISLALLPLALSGVLFTISLAVFFAGFNYLEANLPAKVSQLSSSASRGSSMGVFSICQALGVFAGALIAGMLAQEYNNLGIYIGCALALVWLTTFRFFSHRISK